MEIEKDIIEEGKKCASQSQKDMKEKDNKRLRHRWKHKVMKGERNRQRHTNGKTKLWW